jgi:hypothetical protein
MTSAAPAILEAVLERITYANQDTGYTVARVVTNRSSDQLTLVGPLLGAQPGESLHLQGQASCSWSHVGYATGQPHPPPDPPCLDPVSLGRPILPPSITIRLVAGPSPPGQGSS